MGMLGEQSDHTAAPEKLLSPETLASLPPVDRTHREIAAEPERVIEGAFEAGEVIHNAKNSADFLCALAMPTVYEYAFPPVYLSVWSWLTEYSHKVRDFSQLALGLPRGFAKTTLMKLFILYCILFTNRQFILIVCESTPKALAIIADIMDMLAEANIVQVFGDYRIGLQIDRQELKKFGFRGRDIILAGIGSGGDPRGLNIKHRRPDVMLMDDIQSREDADSEVLSSALERWMVGSLMKAKSPRGCLFLFVANMYPTPHSILRKLKRNPRWIKFIAGGILADGTSLWEELQPISQLLAEYANDVAASHPEIFYAEVLNDENASANNLIDFHKLPALPYTEGDISAGSFIVIDPSQGKKGSDDVAIGYFEVYESMPVIREIKAGKYSPMDTIKVTLEIALRRNCSLIVCEGTGYQATLLYWFDFVTKQLGVFGLDFVEMYPGTKSKNSRILAMFKGLQSGELFIDPACRAVVQNEAVSFNPLRTDNIDNVLDLLTYAPRVLHEYGNLVRAKTIMADQEFRATEVIEEGMNTCF
jgi:hypothetical protein